MDPLFSIKFFPGVILYILLVGYPPFWDEDQHRLYAQVRFLFILLLGSTSCQPSFLNKPPFVLICLMPCSAFLGFSQPHVNSIPLVLSKRHAPLLTRVSCSDQGGCLRLPLSRMGHSHSRGGSPKFFCFSPEKYCCQNI